MGYSWAMPPLPTPSGWIRVPCGWTGTGPCCPPPRVEGLGWFWAMPLPLCGHIGQGCPPPCICTAGWSPRHCPFSTPAKNAGHHWARAWWQVPFRQLCSACDSCGRQGHLKPTPILRLPPPALITRDDFKKSPIFRLRKVTKHFPSIRLVH